MEIVDKMLVDAIPKVFIMMLVMNFLDFVKGVDADGRSYHTSLLREVLNNAQDEEKKTQLVTRSHSHQQMIETLRERRGVCEETIKIIDNANSQLNACT